MINVYTKKNLLPPNCIFINNIKAFFTTEVRQNFRSCSKYKEILSCIDHATIVGDTGDVIITPFGITTIDNISTGCKSVFCYFQLLKMFPDLSTVVLDLSKCGANGIEFILQNEYMHESGMGFFIVSSYNLSDYEHVFKINGVEQRGLIF